MGRMRRADGVRSPACRRRRNAAGADRQRAAGLFVPVHRARSGGYEYSIPGAVVDAKIAEMEKTLAEIFALAAGAGEEDFDEIKAMQDDVKTKLAELTKADRC